MCHVIFNAATATQATLPRDLDAVETIPERRILAKIAFNGVRTRSNASFSFYGSSECLIFKFIERRGYVLDKMTRFSLDRKVSFDLFKFLFPSSSFVSYISLFLSRIL